MTTPRLSRRTMLRGIGATLGLPLLEAMGPALAFGAPAAAAQSKHPLRMAFFYVPNGAHMVDWTPKETGEKFTLPYILEPLQPYQKDLLVFTGLTQDNARAHGDGGGDHARSAACFLTGCHPKKTDGAEIRAGVSVDQAAAREVGKHTRFASLELGCERGAQAGNCDSGYSCAYSSNIAWKTDSTPVAKEVDPRLVFDRLFGGDSRDESPEQRARRKKYRTSVLDLVHSDAGALQQKVGATDKRKLDEYLTSVRELEQRIQKAERGTGDGPQMARPTGTPGNYGEHIRVLGDLLAVAFQTDSTRIATFMYANEGSNRSYQELGAPEGHHDLSHHQMNKDKLAKIRKINRFHMEQFAHFVKRISEIKEGDGTLLDHSMIAYGSAISDGDRHNHEDLPLLLLGRGNGTLKTGRHLKYPNETPLNNLWLSLLDRMGAHVERLGDGTGRLNNLS